MPDLPTRLAYQPNGNGFELIDPDRHEESSGLGEIDRKDIAKEIVRRWNAHDSTVLALEAIASLHDKDASKHLEETGEYFLFDEPDSVRTARETLAEIQPTPDPGPEEAAP